MKIDNANNVQVLVKLEEKDMKNLIIINWLKNMDDINVKKKKEKQNSIWL